MQRPIDCSCLRNRQPPARPASPTSPTPWFILAALFTLLWLASCSPGYHARLCAIGPYDIRLCYEWTNPPQTNIIQQPLTDETATYQPLR